MTFDLKKIKQYNLCLGCGLCEEIGKASGIKMSLDKKGFYEPLYTQNLSKSACEQLSNLCPAINIECILNRETSYGKVLNAYEGWSTDDNIRRISSSGGVITSLACHLLATGTISGVLQVGVKEGEYLYNALKVSRTKEDVMSCASSRYAPALIFHNITDIFKETNDVFLFVGKPCDIMTMKKYISQNPIFTNKIALYISLVCAGMPSYNASSNLINSANNKSEPISLKYRGDGWPGNFKVSFKDGGSFSCSYNDSWGKVLGRDICFRCKICPDGIGQYADIVVGDAWDTVDGYPDFTEKEGKSFILIRSHQGLRVIQDAHKKRIINLSPLSLQNLEKMQPYQYNRLHTIAYRLIPAFFLTRGVLKIRNMKISKNNILKGLRISFGTIYRFYYKRK